MIQSLKRQIWEASGRNLELINKCKEKIVIEPNTLNFYEALLRRVQEATKPKKVKKKPPNTLTEEQKRIYRDAKFKYDSVIAPNWIKDGHFVEPIYPNVATSAGLTEYIVKYLNWTGCNATRINNMGVQRAGVWTKSSTRNGTADITSTINGRSVKFEIKIGRDKPSAAQLKEQQRERRAGGEYFFTHTVDEFFQQLSTVIQQKELF